MIMCQLVSYQLLSSEEQTTVWKYRLVRPCHVLIPAPPHGSVAHWLKDDFHYFRWSVYHTTKIYSTAGQVTLRHDISATTAHLTSILHIIQLLPTQVTTLETVTLVLHVANKELVRHLQDKSPLGMKQALLEDSDLFMEVKKCVLMLGIYTFEYIDSLIDTSPQSLQAAKAEAQCQITETAESKLQLLTATGIHPLCPVYIEREGHPYQRSYTQKL